MQGNSPSVCVSDVEAAAFSTLALVWAEAAEETGEPMLLLQPSSITQRVKPDFCQCCLLRFLSTIFTNPKLLLLQTCGFLYKAFWIF